MGKLPCLTVLFMAVIFLGCFETPSDPGGNDPTEPKDTSTTRVATIPTIDQDSVAVLEKAAQVIQVLKSKDLLALAPHIHPEIGIRFSPYTSVDSADLVFKRPTLKDLLKKKVLKWGVYDGSGEDMKLSYSDYHDRFVYDYDFIDADSVFYNAERQYGNSINNIKNFYPEGKVVEYYISGKEREYAGFEWRALRLVFEQVEGEWYLVGIVHSEWTI